MTDAPTIVDTKAKIAWLRRYAPTQPNIFYCSRMLDICDALQATMQREAQAIEEIAMVKRLRDIIIADMEEREAKLRAMIEKMLKELDDNQSPYEGTYIRDSTEAEARALLQSCDY